MKIRQELLLVFLLVLVAGGAVLAQTYKNVDATPRGITIGSTAVPLNLIASEIVSSTTTNQSVSNAVYVQQIGNNNRFESNLRSVQSNVGLYQYGNNNETYLNINSARINEQVFQFGNNHVFYDIGNGLNLYHEGQVIQTGTNQQLYWIGNNSISDRLRVTMQGNNQTVIIRNFQRQ